MKLYIKRNLNQLAELAFGENYKCGVGLAMLFSSRLNRIVTGLISPNYINFKKWRRIYLGECSEEQLNKSFDGLCRFDKEIIKPYLEIVE